MWAEPTPYCARAMSASGTREQILSVSAGLFARHGITGTTMRAIAGGCSIKAASLYHYFDSKDEIVAAIMTRSSASIVARHDGIRAAGLPPRERVEALVRATLENFRDHPEAARMFYENPAYVADAPLLQRVRDEARENDALWVQTIDDAIGAGALRDDIDPARMKVLLRSMMRSISRDIDPTRMGDVTDDAVALLLTGVLAQQ
jgi:TetR/AcrR family transcriptional regulator, cholesterol catabolism regulator